MARYYKDHKGCVHVVSGLEEYTFCGWAFDVCNDMDGHGEWEQVPPMEFHNGPANCEPCKKAIKRDREAASGARWSKTLITTN